MPIGVYLAHTIGKNIINVINMSIDVTDKLILLMWMLLVILFHVV